MSEKYAITARLDWDTDKTDEENIAAATGGAGTVGRVGTSMRKERRKLKAVDCDEWKRV